MQPGIDQTPEGELRHGYTTKYVTDEADGNIPHNVSNFAILLEPTNQRANLNPAKRIQYVLFADDGQLNLAQIDRPLDYVNFGAYLLDILPGCEVKGGADFDPATLTYRPAQPTR